MRLADKVAIVTGAASGQGRATAVMFAAEGAKVVVADLDLAGASETVNLIQSTGGTAIAVATDVTRAADMKRMAELAVEQFGALHILVNNAGVNLFADVEEMEEDQWDLVVGTNLKSIYLGCKYAIPLMRQSGGGAIVNIASISGLMGQARHIAYCATKAGAINMTKALAIDHGPDGIRVNAVCPGAVMTPMLGRVINAEDPVQMQALANSHPLRRIADPDEIARVTLFLSSDDASFVTGAILLADGGLAAGTQGPARPKVDTAH